MESAFRLIAIRFLLAFVVLALSVGAFAQGGTGELTGLVTDPTGAVVSGAQINLINSATGEKRTTSTTPAGVYRFSALPIVGTYTLDVSQKGFKAVKVAGIIVSTGTTVTHDVKLEVGAAGETITVEAGAELVQTSESAISTLVDRSVWQNIPLENRSQNVFIELSAGAVPDAQAGSTRGAAVNGARGGTGNYLVDGMDNNEQGQGGRGQIGFDPGGASTSISPDAIQEFRLITNSFSAEYGKAGGFVTDTVLRAGTNAWHGSLFEYNRVQALAAQHFFSHPYWGGTPDSLVRNQFGGAIGGPVMKDKSFFFFTMEFNRLRSAAPITATSTTQQYLDFVNSGGLQTWAESSTSGLCNNQAFLDNYFGDGSLNSGGTATPCTGAFGSTESTLGSSALGPIFQKLASVGPFPLATNANTFSSAGAGFYTGTTDADGNPVVIYPVPVYGTVQLSDPTHLNEYRISGKYDYKLTNNDQLSAIYLLQNANSGSPYDGGGNTVGPAYINDGRGQTVGVTWNHTFSPTVLNSFRMGFLRHRSDYPPATPGLLGIPMILTWYDPMTVGFGLYAGLPQYFTENQFQYQDSLSFVRGKHSFRTGAEYRRTRNGSSFYNDTFGTFYPYGIEDLATDLAFTDQADLALTGELSNGSVNYASAAVNPATGGLPEVYRGYRANEFAAYFQDDWRIHPRLTLNWGLRWEYFGPPHNYKPNIDSNFYFGTPVTPIQTTSNNPFFPGSSPFYASVSTATFQVRNNEIWNKDTNNFGPRLGFSWDVFGTQKFVLRAGAGVMYDRIYNNVFENIRFNPPYFADNQIGPGYNGVPVGALATPGLYTVPFTSTGSFAGGYSALPNPRHMDQNMVTPYYEQFHLGTQWELLKGYMLETDYVGTFGHKLVGYRDINTFDGRVACPTTSAPFTSGPCFNAGYVDGLSTKRISPIIGADNYRSNSYASNYHAVQATLRKNYTNGVGFNVNYTYSKALDYLSDVFNARAGGARPTDSMNPKLDYGLADFDMKHRFVGTISYELPFMKNNRWVGGWTVNTLFSVQSGVPFSPYSSSSRYDLNKDGINTDRIVYVGSGKPMNSVTGNSSPATGYFNTADWKRYVCPTSVNQGLWCSAPIGRGTLISPGYRNVDLGVSKKFKITEHSALQLQANFFNVLNHPNFEVPTFNSSSPTFGTSTSTFDPRITQLAVRLDF